MLKHQLTGGWWLTADGKWERPGSSIHNFIHAHPTLQALVGWTSTEMVGSDSYHFLLYLQCLGSFKLEPLKCGANQKVERQMYIPWSLTHGAKALNCASEDADSQWTPCRFAIACSEDKCFRGSWIFARSPLHVSLMCYCFSSLAYNT